MEQDNAKYTGNAWIPLYRFSSNCLFPFGVFMLSAARGSVLEFSDKAVIVLAG